MWEQLGPCSLAVGMLRRQRLRAENEVHSTAFSIHMH